MGIAVDGGLCACGRMCAWRGSVQCSVQWFFNNRSIRPVCGHILATRRRFHWTHVQVNICSVCPPGDCLAYTYAHAHTYAHTYAYAHAHTLAHTHARAPARACAHAPARAHAPAYAPPPCAFSLYIYTPLQNFFSLFGGCLYSDSKTCRSSSALYETLRLTILSIVDIALAPPLVGVVVIY